MNRITLYHASLVLAGTAFAQPSGPLRLDALGSDAAAPPRMSVRMDLPKATDVSDDRAETGGTRTAKRQAEGVTSSSKADEEKSGRPEAQAGLPQIDAQAYGVVDDDATDNTDNLRTALSVAAVSGKCLFLPVIKTGVYRVQPTLDISVANVCLGSRTKVINLDGSPYTGGPFLLRFAAAPATYQFGKRVVSPGSMFHSAPSLIVDNSSYRIDRSYNGVVTAASPQQAYTNSGEVLRLHQEVGRTAVASGSGRNLALETVIINADNGRYGGRSEWNPISHGLIVEQAANCTSSTCSVARGTAKNASLNLYDDFTLSGNTSTDLADREGFLGFSFLVNKRAPGNVIDSKHDGAHGIVVSTSPTADPFGYQLRTHPTYPLNDMIHLTGITGPKNAFDIATGATPGANIGIQIGGAGGSVWTPPTMRSYFPVGVQIDDYSLVGIHCQNPLVAGARCIQSESGAGTVQSADGFQMVPVAVSALPSCDKATRGTLRAVTDATAPTYRGVLVGGGTAGIPVYCDGTSWTAH